MGVTYFLHCKNCGFNKKIKLGVGFFGMEVPEQAQKDIESGKIGGEIKSFYDSLENPQVLAQRAVYRCAYCGDLQNIPEIFVRGENGEVYKHVYRCKKCRKADLEIVDTDDKLPSLSCPKCGKELEIKDIEAWD